MKTKTILTILLIFSIAFTANAILIWSDWFASCCGLVMMLGVGVVMRWDKGQRKNY
jgi:hypothetical protein